MATSEVIYLGTLRTKATHHLSGMEIITDAPTDNEGMGGAFSPTDMVATALGSCMLTTMGIVARRHDIDLQGISVSVTKVMAPQPRRIAEIHIIFDWNGFILSLDNQIRLKNAALTCPVALSLDPEIKQVVDFGY
ncbi:MAG: OsmC family protein [Cytophagales bacterium]|nr:OsmC family protein [Cytophagales bacterium]